MKEKIKDRNISTQFWKEKKVDDIKKLENVIVNLRTKG